jgi:hypothetical protein
MGLDLSIYITIIVYIGTVTSIQLTTYRYPLHSLISYAQWGIVSPVSNLARLEHAGLLGYLDELDVLVLSYDRTKPPAAETHQALVVAWVNLGGVLVI